VVCFSKQFQKSTPPFEAQNAHGKYETEYFKETMRLAKVNYD